MQSNNLTDLRDQLNYNMMLMEKNSDSKNQDMRDKITEIHLMLSKKANDEAVRKWVGEVVHKKVNELNEYMTKKIDSLSLKVDMNHNDVFKQMN